jgi:glutaredoxin
MPRILTHNEFISKLEKVNSNVIVLGRYEDSRTYVNVKCKKCNHTWESVPRNLLTGYGCAKCAKVKKLTHEEFIERIKNINSNVEILGKYEKIDIKILTRCLVCKHEWNVTPSKLFNKRGCPECAKKVRGKKRALKHEDFVDRVTLSNPNIEILGKYEINERRIKLRCKKCNTIWNPFPRDVYYSNNGCPYCKESKGERKIKLFLKERNVNFEFQKRFFDCKDRRTLPFDFYLPEYNMCIEYDGIQHFRKTGFVQKRGLDYIVKHDKIKTDYCVRNNIRLLRLTYRDEIDEKLRKLFDKSL